MSVLHPSVEVEVICADYFGDELVLPLPKLNNKMDSYKSSGKNTAARVAGKPAATEVQNKGTDHHHHPSSHKKSFLGFSPAFDGLHCFETLNWN